MPDDDSNLFIVCPDIIYTGCTTIRNLLYGRMTVEKKSVTVSLNDIVCTVNPEFTSFA